MPCGSWPGCKNSQVLFPWWIQFHIFHFLITKSYLLIFFFKPEDISGKELNQLYGKVILYCQGDKKDGFSLFGDALREYVSLGSLERTEIYFSQFWMLDVQNGGSGSGGAFLLPPQDGRAGQNSTFLVWPCLDLHTSLHYWHGIVSNMHVLGNMFRCWLSAGTAAGKISCWDPLHLCSELWRATIPELYFVISILPFRNRKMCTISS